MDKFIDTENLSGIGVIGVENLDHNTFTTNITTNNTTNNYMYHITKDVRELGIQVQQSSSNPLLDGSTSKCTPEMEDLIARHKPRPEQQSQVELTDRERLSSDDEGCSKVEAEDLLERILAGVKSLTSAFPIPEQDESVTRISQNLDALKPMTGSESIFEGLKKIHNYIYAHLPPIYGLLDSLEHIDEEQAKTKAEGIHLYGMFLQLLQQQPVLPRKTMHQQVKILFLGNSKVRSKEAFEQWIESTYFRPRRPKPLFSQNQAVIQDCWSFDTFRLSSCNLEVSFRFANYRDEYREALRNSSYQYVVLCFKTSDSSNLNRTLNKWNDMDTNVRKKHPPKVLLGFAPGGGAARTHHTADEASQIDTQRSFSIQNSNRQTCSHQATKLDMDIYIECASTNDKARDKLFTTLIGCAAAYHYQRLHHSMQ